jgi:hypothetical protein
MHENGTNCLLHSIRRKLGRIIVLYILKEKAILRKLEKRKARCVQCDFLRLTKIRESSSQLILDV